MSELDLNVIDFIMQPPVKNAIQTVQHKRKTCMHNLLRTTLSEKKSVQIKQIRLCRIIKLELDLQPVSFLISSISSSRSNVEALDPMVKC